jgi:hydrogenase maturation factor
MGGEPPKSDKTATDSVVDSAPESSVAFHFIKSNSFRVVYANGAYGGITPRGEIHASFYNERSAIPRMIVHRIEEGTLGEPLEIVTRGGIVREVEVDLVMSPETAMDVGNWLIENAKKILELQEQSEGQDDSN